MRTPILYVMLVLGSLILSSCGEIDDIYPSIDMNSAGAFPQNCDTVYRGESFVFRATFSDNKELGGFSLDIHHNFDHHSHSTEVSNCELMPLRSPTSNVLVFIKTFDIPAGIQEYRAEVMIEVPPGVDTGDYHFLIRLTDQEGWQTIKGISIKVLDR
jgi:hypothetical protein